MNAKKLSVSEFAYNKLQKMKVFNPILVEQHRLTTRPFYRHKEKANVKEWASDTCSKDCKINCYNGVPYAIDHSDRCYQETIDAIDKDTLYGPGGMYDY